jgi:tetratricopeptide (TPR) repeat protein
MGRWSVLPALVLFLFSGIRELKGQNPVTEIKFLLESYEFSRADSLAERYLAEDSTRTDLLLLKGKAQAAMFRYPEARATLQQGIRIDSTNLRLLNEMAEVCRISGDLDQAVAINRKICALAPGNHFYRIRLANLLIAGENYTEAGSILLPIYEADSGSFFIARQLGNCFMEPGQPEKAVRFYRQALRIIPLDPYVTGKLVNCFIRLNEISMALYRTEVYLSEHPDYLPVLRQNGYCNYLLLDVSLAASRFRECIRLGDSSKFTLKYLGLSYYKQELYDSAAPFFREAFRSDTTDAEVCFYYGVSANRSLDPETGLEYLEKSRKLLLPPGPFLSSLYAEMASALTTNGKADTAEILLEKALEVNPSDNSIRFKIAYQYDYHMHKPQLALPWYREFLKYDAGNGDTTGSGPMNVPMTVYVKRRIPQITGK